MNGWIKLYRNITEWEWFDDDKLFKFFIYLIVTATHQNVCWHGITIERGQLITSRERLSRELHCSEQQVRTMISKLQKTNEITTKATNKYTIITVCNYDRYQSANDNEQPTNQPTNNQQITNEQPTNNQQITTYKNNKNEKNNKNIINEIADESANKSNKKKTVLDIEPIIAQLPEQVQDIIRRWVTYKKTQFNFTYKSEDSFKTWIRDLYKLSNRDINKMNELVDCAISKSWQGIFAPKQTGPDRRIDTSERDNRNFDGLWNN